MNTQTTTKPVSKRALIARINRKLPGYNKIKTLRGDRWLSSLGRYYEVDEATNAVINTHLDLEELAKGLGVLKGWERLEDE